VIEKIISGGQVGVDIAALRAAYRLGIPTGGWCPAGCRTLEGRNPKLVTQYRLREHESAQYPPRTYANVRDSDATLRFAVTFGSAGEKCTLRAIKAHRKPHLDVQMVLKGERWIYDPSVRKIQDFLRHNEVQVLNVAGNARRDMEVAVEVLLTKVLSGENL